MATAVDTKTIRRIDDSFHRPHFRCVFPYRVLRVPGLPSLLRPTSGAL